MSKTTTHHANKELAVVEMVGQTDCDARIALGLSRVVRGLDWLAARMQHAGGAAQEAGEQDVAEAWLEAAKMVMEYMDHLRADPAYRTTPTHGGE